MASFKPQHLKDMVSEKLSSTSSLYSALANLTTRILQDPLPPEIKPVFFGTSLCALNKKDGGIRPIAVGCCLRRLLSKIICYSVSEKVGIHYPPSSVTIGYGTKCGSEAITHATRRFVSISHSSPDFFLKIYFFNAFNMIFRPCFLSEVYKIIPEYFFFN